MAEHRVQARITTMSTQILEPAERSLSELADIANAEHDQVLTSLAGAVAHAIAAGAALHEAHNQIRAGKEIHSTWTDWVSSNLRFGRAMASRYERLAVYADDLPPEAFQPRTNGHGHIVQPTVNHAWTYVRGLPPLHPPRALGVPESTITEARRLSDKGVPRADIADILGVSRNSVYKYTTPGGVAKARQATSRRANRQRLERAALRREQAAKAAKSASADISEAYSNIRKTLQILDRVANQTDSKDIRREANFVIAELHKAEDRMSRLLRTPADLAQRTYRQRDKTSPLSTPVRGRESA
jgi:predicted transcriptional regulator